MIPKRLRAACPALLGALLLGASALAGCATEPGYYAEAPPPEGMEPDYYAPIEDGPPPGMEPGYSEAFRPPPFPLEVGSPYDGDLYPDQ